jgi:hypothetical protein
MNRRHSWASRRSCSKRRKEMTRSRASWCGRLTCLAKLRPGRVRSYCANRISKRQNCGSCRLMVRDGLKLGSAFMRVGESGVGRISRLGEPGYQSSQLYRMGRSCCIYTRSVISTREKKSKQKDVDMKLNVMYKTGYQLGVKNAHLQFPHTRANHNFNPVPVQAPYVWCPSRSIAYDAGVLAKQTKRGVWWFGSSRKC